MTKPRPHFLTGGIVVRGAVALLAVIVWSCATAAPHARPDDIAVTVAQHGGKVTIDVELNVDASPQETWAVLTDFDNLASFVSGLEVSQVIEKYDAYWTVLQRGRAGTRPFSVPYESIRSVELLPYETIRAKLISGSVRHYVDTTRLIADGARTRIVSNAECIPGVWLPPFIGIAFVREETRSQFSDLRTEILRRRNSRH